MPRSRVMNEATIQKMDNWVSWLRSGYFQHYQKLWYPCLSPQGQGVASNNVWDKTPKKPPVDELDAQKIEKAITSINQSEEYLARCLVGKWLFNLSERDLSKELHCCRNVARETTDRAETALQVLLVNG